MSFNTMRGLPQTGAMFEDGNPVANQLLRHLGAHGDLSIPALRAWEGTRTLPEWRGGEFRKWLKARTK